LIITWITVGAICRIDHHMDHCSQGVCKRQKTCSNSSGCGAIKPLSTAAHPSAGYQGGVQYSRVSGREKSRRGGRGATRAPAAFGRLRCASRSQRCQSSGPAAPPRALSAPAEMARSIPGPAGVKHQALALYRLRIRVEDLLGKGVEGVFSDVVGRHDLELVRHARDVEPLLRPAGAVRCKASIRHYK